MQRFGGSELELVLHPTKPNTSANLSIESGTFNGFCSMREKDLCLQRRMQKCFFFPRECLDSENVAIHLFFFLNAQFASSSPTQLSTQPNLQPPPTHHYHPPINLQPSPQPSPSSPQPTNNIITPPTSPSQHPPQHHHHHQMDRRSRSPAPVLLVSARAQNRLRPPRHGRHV